MRLSRQLHTLSAVDAVAAMRSGELKAEDYAATLLARAEQFASLNAFRTLRPEEVLAAARASDKRRSTGGTLGLMHGLPLPVKDSVNTKGLPTSSGTRALRDFVPRSDAQVLQPLFEQGALLMGKTNLHELSFGWTSNNAAFGPVRNPYDPARTPGGSSGGSAAAVAALIAPLAIAEDTWGSIRVPSSFCGLCGLRPTYGRYPNEGILPLTRHKFDQVGPLARSVGDLVLFDSVVTGDHTRVKEGSLAGVRIGLSPDYLFADLDKEAGRIVGSAIERLKHAGVKFVQAELPPALREAPMMVRSLIIYDALDCFASFLKTYGAPVTLDELLAQTGANLERVLNAARNPGSAENHQTLLKKRTELKALTVTHYREHNLDAMAFPPVLTPAFPQGDPGAIEINGHPIETVTAIGRNIGLGSCASLACLVLPAGITAGGLPVGLEFDALPGSDRRLLSIGLALEKVLGPIPSPAGAPAASPAARPGTDL